jgi:hypothetical protein
MIPGYGTDVDEYQCNLTISCGNIFMTAKLMIHFFKVTKVSLRVKGGEDCSGLRPNMGGLRFFIGIARRLRVLALSLLPDTHNHNTGRNVYKASISPHAFYVTM